MKLWSRSRDFFRNSSYEVANLWLRDATCTCTPRPPRADIPCGRNREMKWISPCIGSIRLITYFLSSWVKRRICSNLSFIENHKNILHINFPTTKHEKTHDWGYSVGLRLDAFGHSLWDLKKMISGGHKRSVVGYLTRSKYMLAQLTFRMLIWEELRASCCPVATRILPISGEMRTIRVTTSVFWFECVSVYKNLLFLYGYEHVMNLCFGIDCRKILEERVPIIGQSGLVKGHSLSRRHRQYSRNSETKRGEVSCHIYSKVFHIHLSTIFWLTEEVQ